MPTFANRSMFGISSAGIREFPSASSIATGVPFQAQSSMNSNTMLGLVGSVCSAAADRQANSTAKSANESLVALFKKIAFMCDKFP
jgi:hypothetical protein